MSQIKNDIDKELKEIEEEMDIPDNLEGSSGSDKPLINKIAERIFPKQVVNELENGTYARASLITAFLVIAALNAVFNVVEAGQPITPELLWGLIGAVFVYFIFRFGMQVYNKFQTILRKNSLENDVRDIEKAQRVELNKLDYLSKKAEIVRTNMVVLKNQFRLDEKHTQDLTLRLPLYQKAQDKFMSLFNREDIAKILEVPPSLINAVKQMDEQLLRSDNIGNDELVTLVKDMYQSQERITNTLTDHGKLLDQLIQREAELMVFYGELGARIDRNDLVIKSVTKQLEVGLPSPTVQDDTPSFVPPEPEDDTNDELGLLPPPPMQGP